jgi:lon-related putative ATP-dependent protease
MPKKIMDRLKEFFGKSDESWDWENFQSTENYPVSPNLIDWIIGQEHAITECKLCIDEWVNKLGWLNEKKWWKPFEIVEKPKRELAIKFRGHKIHLFNYGKKELVFNPKPLPKEMLPSGPFLLMLGDAGTGKSLLGRAMQSYMTDLYQKKGIKLYDTCSWYNKTLPCQPRISIHPSPEGTKIIKKAAKMEAKKGRFVKWGFKAIILLMMSIGIFILGYIGISGLTDWYYNVIWTMWGETVQEFFHGNFLQYMVQGCIMSNIQLVISGIMALSMGGMLYIFSRFMGGMIGGNKKGVGGAEATQAPKLLIDNSSGIAPFIDATGHRSAQLFGSIAWDPYQTGDLGTPEHQRVTAGDVHRAHLGILYIDEIKNLIGDEAITLLTVLEDGQLPVAMRGSLNGGDTAAMAVATEPIPCMNFLIAAGNLDSLPHIHYALLDRIHGYGKMVYMSNDMPNIPENRRKYVQFISQEVKRFHLLPLSRDACIAVIEEAIRKSGKNNTITCKFRPMIGTIKTASVLAQNEGLKIVERKHVNDALNEHCKSIALQVMEKQIENHIIYNTLIDPTEEPKVGQIHGLAVSTINVEGTDMVGSVLTIRASCLQKTGLKSLGYFTVTGVATKDSSYVQHSIAKVRHVILQLYGIDVEQECYTHVDFAQEHGVEGPSAGITMTLALASVLLQKKIRQDVAVTGEINIANGDLKAGESGIEVTSIGGAHEKILAAQRMGFKKVCIPQRNYEKNINPSDYTLKVVGCKTIQDYIRECFEP